MEAIEKFLAISSGDGSGDGSGFGFGDGDGSGYGYGSGYGNGSGYDDGVKSINGNIIHQIDSVNTIIYSIHNSIARGAIFNKDLTLSPCYIAKVEDYFAHGKTVKEAIKDATNKAFQNKPIEQRIESFLAKFGTGKHPAKDYMEWHGLLTGSCRMGRENFAKNNGINENDLYSIDDFIRLTKNAYGGDVIKQIEQLLKPTQK